MAENKEKMEENLINDIDPFSVPLPPTPPEFYSLPPSPPPLDLTKHVNLTREENLKVQADLKAQEELTRQALSELTPETISSLIVNNPQFTELYSLWLAQEVERLSQDLAARAASLQLSGVNVSLAHSNEPTTSAPPLTFMRSSNTQPFFPVVIEQSIPVTTEADVVQRDDQGHPLNTHIAESERKYHAEEQTSYSDDNNSSGGSSVDSLPEESIQKIREERLSSLDLITNKKVSALKKVELAKKLGYSDTPTPSGEPDPKEFSLQPPEKSSDDFEETNQAELDAEVARATKHNPKPAAKPGKTALVKTPKKGYFFYKRETKGVAPVS